MTARERLRGAFVVLVSFACGACGSSDVPAEAAGGSGAQVGASVPAAGASTGGSTGGTGTAGNPDGVAAGTAGESKGTGGTGSGVAGAGSGGANAPLGGKVGCSWAMRCSLMWNQRNANPPGYSGGT